MYLNKMRAVFTALFMAAAGQLYAQHYQMDITDAQKDNSWTSSIIGADKQGNLVMSGARNAGANSLRVMFPFSSVKTHKFVKTYNSDLSQISNAQIVSNTDQIKQSWIKKGVTIQSMMIDGRYCTVIKGKQNKRVTFYLAEIDHTNGNIVRSVKIFRNYALPY